MHSAVLRGVATSLLLIAWSDAAWAASPSTARKTVAQGTNSGPVMVSRPVVQPLAQKGGDRLQEALLRLARNANDLSALLDAGDAALEKGNVEAAHGFYLRASKVAPSNSKAIAGIAGTLVRSNDPVAAIAQFDRAEAAGADPVILAMDRGLAYDLVGDNAKAQALYKVALSGGSDIPEITRRLALSQAIAGDYKASGSTLTPLLRQQDKTAWRTRAFALAIAGDVAQADAIAKSQLTPSLAAAMSPYFQSMRRLTRAQQAAAATFGVFPPDEDIGTDSPQIARLSAAAVPANALPAAQPSPTLQVAKSAVSSAGRKSVATRKSVAAGKSVAQAQSSNVPTPATRSATRVAAAPVVNQPALPPPSTPAPSSPPSVASALPPPTSPPPSPPVSAPTPTPALLPPEAAPMMKPAREDLLEAFKEFGAPQLSVEPATGSVDVRSIPKTPKPAKVLVKAEKTPPPKPAPPKHPARTWVQVGIGSNVSALRWDWQKLTKAHAAAFKDVKPWVSVVNRTKRLLAGPFSSDKQAREFINGLSRAGLKGPFMWKSETGEVVDPLGK